MTQKEKAIFVDGFIVGFGVCGFICWLCWGVL